MIDEPLELSAPLARELAPKLCRRDPATGESCEWNHGFWQYLRLMGLAATPADHAEFFEQAFQLVANENRNPRVLISGAVDYCMLAHLLAALRKRHADPQVAVVDRCETPLWLNRWYAERMSLTIDTHCADVLAYRSDEPFDALCTHGFLGFFSPHQRPVLLQLWRSLLRSGGLAITVNRMRSQAEGPRYAFSSEQAKAFRDTLLDRAARLPSSLRVAEQELRDYADLYALRKRSGYSVRSQEELSELFDRGGFQIERMTCSLRAESASAEQNASAKGGGTRYALIISRRL